LSSLKSFPSLILFHRPIHIQQGFFTEEMIFSTRMELKSVQLFYRRNVGYIG
jgi:hypothetical protein